MRNDQILGKDKGETRRTTTIYIYGSPKIFLSLRKYQMTNDDDLLEQEKN